MEQQQRTAGGVTFTLTRRRVKNLNLRVRPDGSVAVSAPARTPLREVDAFVAAHTAWPVRLVFITEKARPSWWEHTSRANSSSLPMVSSRAASRCFAIEGFFPRANRASKYRWVLSSMAFTGAGKEALYTGAATARKSLSRKARSQPSRSWRAQASAFWQAPQPRQGFAWRS